MNRLYSVIADVAVDPFEDIKDFKFYDEVRYPAENPLTLPLVIVLILLLIGAVTVLIILAVKLSKVNRTEGSSYGASCRSATILPRGTAAALFRSAATLSRSAAPTAAKCRRRSAGDASATGYTGRCSPRS